MLHTRDVPVFAETRLWHIVETVLEQGVADLGIEIWVYPISAPNTPDRLPTIDNEKICIWC